jgi:hypothetical protein
VSDVGVAEADGIVPPERLGVHQLSVIPGSYAGSRITWNAASGMRSDGFLKPCSAAGSNPSRG